MVRDRDIWIGAALGISLSLVVMLGNIVRGDVHTLRVYPGTLTLLLVPAAVFWLATQRRRAGWQRGEVLRFGRRVGLAAGAAFGIAVGVITAYWFAPWSASGLFAASTGFTSVLGFSIVAAWVGSLFSPAAV